MQIYLIFVLDTYTQSKEETNLEKKKKHSSKMRKALTTTVLCNTLCQISPDAFFYHRRMCDIVSHLPHIPEPFQRILRFQDFAEI
jgi:hypothetical protein